MTGSATRRSVGLVLASLAVLVASTGTAAAHAKLLSVKPADGSTVERPPAAVVLTYSEVVQNKGAQIMVIAPSGARVDQGAPRFLDETVTQPLGPLTEPGTYKVTARIVSADGHPIIDQTTFVLRTGAPATTAPTGSPTTTAPTGSPTTAPTGSPTTAGTPPAAPPVERSSSTGPVLVAVGLVALVLAALAIALVRHRRAGDPGP